MTDSSRAEAVRQVRVRPDIAALAPYTPTASLEVFAAQLERPVSALIKLDANENPYGPSPRARAALAALDTTHIYPDPEARALRALLSEYAGVDAAHILAGAGADELIALILQLFLAPGDAVVNAPPTFGMYAFDTPLAHGRVIDAPRRADFSLDVPAIEAAARDSGAKLLFICSPNNPDGSVIPPETVERLLALPLVVVLDEAYIEFSGAESLARRVPHTPNLIVLRTFSKWAGLAGLRVGYGIFPAEIIAHLWKIKQPYNVNVAADAAARASLADLPALRANVERLIAARERLERELATLPYLRPFPSRANFVLSRVIGLDAAELRRRLAHDYGILVRHYSAPLLRDCIRISAGTPEQIDALLRALREIGETDV
ncbi:MAG: histidinol-phosphate transaminase [Anaerolineae bacterium]|nr:histidinol-phosphate transaminase [Anaerolineae bacterium]